MRIVGILVVCLALLAPPVFAGQYGGVEEWYLYPSVQYFTWKEFSGGQRLVKEEGPLFGIGGGVRFDLYRKSLLLKVNGEMFGGEVDYDGQTQPLPPLPGPTPNPQSARPVNTDVVYFGTKLESDIGWRMATPAGSFEPFAGLGYRWWLRALQDSTAIDANGNPFPVGGYTEWWHSVYTRLGLRWDCKAGGDLTLFAEGGGKYPFLNRNIADFPGAGDVTVKPEPRWSGFAEVGARYGRFRPVLFYEGFRFGQSPVVPIGGGVGLLQPQSDSDIFGINLGWAFK
jgi:hypothetical protein